MDQDVLQRHAVEVRGKPDGRPMLFAHGFGSDQTLWRFVAPAFEVDHSVITFDDVGAGRSDRSAYDPERYRPWAGTPASEGAIAELMRYDQGAPWSGGYSLAGTRPFTVIGADVEVMSRRRLHPLAR